METNKNQTNVAEMILEGQKAIEKIESVELEKMLKFKADAGDAKATKAIKAISTDSANSSFQGKILGFWSSGTDNVYIHFGGSWKNFTYSNSDQYNAMVMLALHAFTEDRNVVVYYDNNKVNDLYVY